MKKRKFSISNIILVLIFLLGLSLLLYPTFSDWWNSLHQARAIATYQEQVEQIDTTEHDKILHEAKKYNQNLVKSGNIWVMNEEQRKQYESILNISGNGMIGYIEIPTINISLPIYHGTDENVLQVAVGHLEGTSLPVGGKSTHCVLSGHRGLPSAKLFTDLDVMEAGDVFSLHVLDESYYYEVDQIRIVLPEEIRDLTITKDKDYCTLVTCTPYGINTHRLLVRGKRIENPAKIIETNNDAVLVDRVVIAVFVVVTLLVVILLGLLISGLFRKSKKRVGKGEKYEEKSN